MSFIKEKNLIRYIGKKYYITCNMTDGTITTDHPDGTAYILKAMYRAKSPLAKLIYCKVKQPNLNPFIETLATQAADILEEIAFLQKYTPYNEINKIIDTIQNNWKIVRKLNREEINLKSSYGRFLYDLCEKINAIKYNLNETEEKWYHYIQNIDFIKHFAGQLEMYSQFLSITLINDTINWYNQNEIDIKPFLKNKNLLQIITDLYINRKIIQDKIIADGLERISKKYNFLEMIDADGWSYKLLKTNEDFIKEAKDMNNCLMRCRYNEKMSQEKSLIIVAIRPDGVKIDFEIKPTYSILQAFYKNDDRLTQEDKNHLCEWLKRIEEERKKMTQTEN